MLAICQTILASVFLLISLTASKAEDARNILVLYENNRLLPANIEGDRGLNEAVALSGRNVEISAEFLDYPRFGGEAYNQTVITYLKQKYASRPPAILVAGGSGALDFLLRNRAALFPGAPIVHMGVEKDFVDAHNFPPDVGGVPWQVDMAGTVAQALAWHPLASRLVVITGASRPDRAWEADLRTELAPFQKRVSVEFMAGLPTAEVQKRVGALGPGTVIFTPGYFQDGAGQGYTPRDAAAAIASAASAPVYGPFNTFIGTGIVGGRMSNFTEMGRLAGRMVNQLLDGRRFDEMAMPAVTPSELLVDWRQIERWGIDQHAIPPDTEIEFRSPSFWDLYHTPAIIAIAVFFLQTFLLVRLFLERRRRRHAEAVVDEHRFELAHAGRLAVAGELTASIAHEINQPLGAILSNVAAAKLMLASGPAHLEEVRSVLDDIHRDDVRASEIIKRMRSFLAKHKVEQSMVDLNDITYDTETLLRAQAWRRKIELTFLQSSLPSRIMADRVQVQQILINLVLNAMDAVSDMPESRRTINVSVTNNGNSVGIQVADSGHGFQSGREGELFESFFTTKRDGIGLGLSIVRTLVQAHGGKVWAESRSPAGAIFHVDFPVHAAATTQLGAA